MVHCHVRLDAGREQGIDEARVEVEPRLVDRAVAGGVDARPGNGQPEVARAQLLHEPDVLRVQVIKIVRDGACADARMRACISGLLPGLPFMQHMAMHACIRLRLSSAGNAFCHMAQLHAALTGLVLEHVAGHSLKGVPDGGALAVRGIGALILHHI